jgi:hypothetical protein
MSGEWPDLANIVQLRGQSALGESATYTRPARGGDPEYGPYPIRILFSAAHEELNFEDGIPVSSVRPQAQVHAADITAMNLNRPLQGDLLTARGVDYVVVDVRNDGEGDTTLVLHKA